MRQPAVRKEGIERFRLPIGCTLDAKVERARERAPALSAQFAA